MPAETSESKAQKLAAARKKLKEYQKRNSESSKATAVGNTNTEENHPSTPATAGSISSNLSEKSVSELSLNGGAATPTATTSTTKEDPPNEAAAVTEAVVEMTVASAASYFQAMPPAADEVFLKPIANAGVESPQLDDSPPTSSQSINAIQLLIAEKTQISAELSKCRTACRERDLELEEVRTLYTGASARIAELQQRVIAQQQSTDQLRHSNAELQHAVAQSNATAEDRLTHCNELQRQLDLAREHADELAKNDKDQSNALEMAQLRIRQLSDEAAFGVVGGKEDARIETLTQTQFMYEQQIRDLQAMVQQLSQDKEQANIQYQNYVQHLNEELAALNERNSESLDECTKLQERERQLVDHIGGLEREIQRNISRQDQMREEQKQQESSSTTAPELSKEIEKLTEQFKDYSFERHEFQLKIKSQEDRLEQLNAALQQKNDELEMLQERLANVSAIQPDQTKLLATIESDKVAASRALTQNVALKQQLDELELRFVQLTNDKADLVNERDAEEYANREMRSNYTALEERVRTIDERFKFKDEEMIRLSHENMELKRNNLILQQQVDRLQHYEVREYSDKYKKTVENDKISHEHEHHDHDHHDHDHHDHDQHDHDHHDHDHHDHDYHSYDQQDHVHDSHNHHEHQHDDQHDENNPEPLSEGSGDSTCHEATENEGQHYHHDQAPVNKSHANAVQYRHRYQTPHLPTSEAVEKLEQRFTHLMSQVADLTDEKQRLEHLVLQLQSETETIGEYIALYQTQRRILKQREYEKAAQTQLLQAEREQMREKITLLNNLVSSLGVEMPQQPAPQQNVLPHIQEHLNAALAQNVCIEPAAEDTSLLNVFDGQGEQLVEPPAAHSTYTAELALHQKFNSNDSQEILTKIQNIITEIKENTTKEVPTFDQTHTADHLRCCSGKKIETV